MFPTRTRKFETFKIESALFDVGSGEQIWAMQSETVEGSSPDSIIQDQIRLSIEALSRERLI